MFRRIVPITLKLNDAPGFEVAKRMLQFLSDKFSIKMQIISGCFKFIESDIFIYLSHLKQVYLVFVDQLAFIREVTEDLSSHPSKLSQVSSKSKGSVS